MMAAKDKVMTLHPAGKKGVNIDAAKYREMKKAILAVVGRGTDGVAFQDMSRLVEPHLSEDVFGDASVTWYCVTVKLDLEARGVIERVPRARPQRMRRVRGK